MKFILGRAEFSACERGDLLRYADIKALGCVQTGADGRAAQRQSLQLGQGQLDKPAILLQAAAPAGNLLTEFDGRCVL